MLDEPLENCSARPNLISRLTLILYLLYVSALSCIIDSHRLGYELLSGIVEIGSLT